MNLKENKVPKAIDDKVREINRLIEWAKDKETVGGYFGSTHYSYLDFERPIRIKNQFVYIEYNDGSRIVKERYNFNKPDGAFSMEELKWELSRILRAFKKAKRDYDSKGYFKKGGKIENELDSESKVRSFAQKKYGLNDFESDVFVDDFSYSIKHKYPTSKRKVDLFYGKLTDTKYSKGGQTKKPYNRSYHTDRRRLSKQKHEQSYLPKRKGSYYSKGGEVNDRKKQLIDEWIKPYAWGKVDENSGVVKAMAERYGLGTQTVVNLFNVHSKKEKEFSKGGETEGFEDAWDRVKKDIRENTTPKTSDIATLRSDTLRRFGRKIEFLEQRLINPNATLSDSNIHGSDRAKLLKIEELKDELKEELNFIERKISGK